jgi:hypothetical protein
VLVDDRPERLEDKLGGLEESREQAARGEMVSAEETRERLGLTT